MDVLFWVLAVPGSFLGGLGRRMAGGSFEQWTGINPGDYPTRAFWGLTCALALIPLHPTWWAYPAAALAVFLGCAWPIHLRLGSWCDIGGTAQGRGVRSLANDVAGLTLHGVGNLLLLYPLVWWLGGHVWPVFVAGLIISPCYELGWQIARNQEHLRWPAGFRSGPEFGELIWGTVVWWGIFLAFRG